ncbi:replicative DNA helicase [bacterium]|nr:replicative DNA helicase [bacterium]
MTKPPSSSAPPHDPQAEAYVLSAYLTGRADLIEDADIHPKPEWFYESTHREIFMAIHHLHHHGSSTDGVTVAHRLRETDSLKRAGGENKIALLTEAFPTATQIRGHLKILKDYHTRRGLLKVGVVITEEAKKTSSSIRDLLSHAEEEIMSVSDTNLGTKSHDVIDLLGEKSDSLSGTPDLSGVLEGRECDYGQLNTLLGGFRPSNLVILASRPGEGKTSLAINLAFQVGYRSQHPVLFCSLEMTHSELMNRLIASECTRLVDFPPSDGSIRPQPMPLSTLYEALIANGFQSDVQEAYLDALMNNRVASRSDILHIIDKPDLDVTEMHIHARRLKKKSGRVGMVVVDYLQLVRAPSVLRRGGKRYEEVGEVSRSLKKMAKELECPVLAICQLSREIEKREDKRPLLSDLRESGSLEQDADSVIFLHDPSYGNRATERPDSSNIELVVLKNRHGKTGRVKLTFDRPHQRFKPND